MTPKLNKLLERLDHVQNDGLQFYVLIENRKCLPKLIKIIKEAVGVLEEIKNDSSLGEAIWLSDEALKKIEEMAE